MVRKGKGAGSRTHSRTAVSLSDDFGTPPEVCEMTYNYFGGHPDLDPCTGPTAVFRALQMWSAGGLHRPWVDEEEERALKRTRKRVYVNPPYSRLGAWLQKVVYECDRHPLLDVVVLVPGSTSASWWKDYVSRRARAIACTKRLSFLGPEGMKTGETCRFHPALLLYSELEGAAERFRAAYEAITTWFVDQRPLVSVIDLPAEREMWERSAMHVSRVRDVQ